MYSWDGYLDYVEDWFYYFGFIALTLGISPLTFFLPLNYLAYYPGWEIMFSKDWVNWYLFFIPPFMGHFFGIEVENSWIMG